MSDLWFRDGALDEQANAPTLECLIERGGKYYALSVALSGGYSPFRSVTAKESELARRHRMAKELLWQSVKATDWLLTHEDQPLPEWVQKTGDWGGFMCEVDLRQHVPIGWGRYEFKSMKPETFGWVAVTAQPSKPPGTE